MRTALAALIFAILPFAQSSQPHVIATPTGVAVLNGPGSADDEIYPPTAYPLAEAIRRARPFSPAIIGVVGDLSGGAVGIQVGGGDAGLKAYRADWGDQAVDVRIIGVTANRSSRIGTIYLHNDLNDGTQTGGVARIRIENLTIRSTPGTGRCVGSPLGMTGGLLQLYDVNLIGANDGSYGGIGMRWGVRCQGRHQYDIRRVHCAYVQEHVLYLDSPQGPCWFVDLSMVGSWRTMIQIVNRRVANPGPSGSGPLLFDRCTAYNVKGEGGSAFTVAGHLGPVIFRDCTVLEGPNGSQGALAIWVDNSPGHGAYFDADGFATGDVLIQGLRIQTPTADRSHATISGARSVTISGFLVEGNRAAFEFRQATFPNGGICFDVPGPVPAYGGWQSAQKVLWNPGQPLSDAQLLLLSCP